MTLEDQAAAAEAAAAFRAQLTAESNKGHGHKSKRRGAKGKKKGKKKSNNASPALKPAAAEGSSATTETFNFTLGGGSANAVVGSDNGSASAFSFGEAVLTSDKKANSSGDVADDNDAGSAQPVFSFGAPTATSTTKFTFGENQVPE